MSRGRRPVVSSEALGEILEKYRDKIIDNGRIKGKTDEVWNTISDEIFEKTGQKKTAIAVYTHVTCRKVFSQEKQSAKDPDPNPDPDTSVDSNMSTSNSTTRVIQIHFSKQKFDEVTAVKEYHDKKSKTRKRSYSVFVEGKWEVAMTERLWEEHRIACGFLYSRGRLNLDNTASISGKCKCGTTIQCAIADTKRDIIVVTCMLSGFSQEKCSKRPLRKPIRDELALRMVQTEEVPSKLFKAKASEVMVFGDKLPPHLYEPKILADAKYKYLRETRSHQDPLTSLLIMKSGIYKNAIHDVGVHPFYVYYTTSQQLHVYADYAMSNANPTIVIDATGSVVRKVMRPDGTMSGTIFLYAIVIHYKSQIMVTQMLSEAHDALHIGNWLRHYLSIGAPPPKEVVSDDGKAIIIAEIHAFTRYATITEYANACYNHKKPACYIRIDNAHFIKKMANLLKDCQPAVRKLMLASVGQLILARSLEAAGDILGNVFVVCMSSSGGTTRSGQQTACANAIECLKALVTMREPGLNNDINVNVDGENEEVKTLDSRDISDDQYFGPDKNLYHEWAKGIYEDAQRIAETEIGCDPNPYQMNQLAITLLRDCKQLPLWSNVVRDMFGYGRVPATSAIVESAFNNLKTRTLNKKVGLRADVFVQKHLDEISGATIVAAARERGQDDCTPPNIPACPLCAEGTAPTAHFCVLCRRPVHLIFGCSEAISTEDEGFGQKRYCTTCIKRGPSSIEAVIQSREVEKWGGYINEKENEPPQKKKRSFYMGAPINPQELKIRRGRTEWPVLKNSSNINLKPQTIDHKKVSLSYTCAFDAITQVHLRLMEEGNLQEHITSWGSEYSYFLKELHHKGITSNTYKKRAALLYKLMPENKITRSGSVHTVACDIVAAELVTMLLPAFAECSTACETCGYKTTITLKTVSIADSELHRLEDAVGAVFRVKQSKCNQPCPGNRRAETSINSPIVAIDVYETRMELQRVKICQLPKTLTLPTGLRYQLLGVVAYDIAAGSRTRTVKQLAATVQHYTALVQTDDCWTVIDDLKANTSKANTQMAVVPSILIYARLDLD